ncbi:MAG: hypothetical protein FWE30_05650 [Bacteroidales bacterium]|nr:hypothetical protein [Bacteroidales bacterium]
MNDSIITIIAVVAIGLFQWINSMNKRRKAQEQRMRSQTGTYTMDTDFEEVEGPEPVSLFRMLKPQEEGGRRAAPIMAPEPVAEVEEEEPLLADFTPRNAILFSEVMSPKWNT